MLTNLAISNFKSIANCSLSFSEEVVIVGPNGVGKSNLFDAMHFIRDAAIDGLDHAFTKRHGVESVRRWSKTRPYNITLSCEFRRGDEFGSYRVVIGSARGDFTVNEEEGRWFGPHPFKTGDKEADEQFQTSYFKREPDHTIEFSLPNSPVVDSIPSQRSSPSELALSNLSPNIPSITSFFFSKLFEEITDAGAYSIYPNKIREPQSISNADVLFDDGTNLASIIRQMRTTTHRKRKEQLTDAVKTVLPIVEEIKIDSAGGFFVPVFRVRELQNSSAHELNMSQVSDGTLRMLGMLTAFYQPKAPDRITLEEPEQMIHPGLLPILVDSGRDFLDRSDNKQLFYTTHSPTLLDSFEAEQIISCSFRGGESCFSSMSPRQVRLVKDHLFTPGELLVKEGIIA